MLSLFISQLGVVRDSFCQALLSTFLAHPDPGLIISILGIFATISVTFLTLLFAIAAINSSFQSGRKINKDSGDYPLKLLIKVDLQRTSLRTVIPQLIIIGLVFIFHDEISKSFWSINILWAVIVTLLVYYVIYTLWTTTNSVYYSIIQYNQDEILNTELETLNKSSSESKDLEPICYKFKPYDVYTIKKTLFPKVHKSVYKRLRKSGSLSLPKHELVMSWNNEFISEIDNIIDDMRVNCNDDTLLSVLHSSHKKKISSCLKSIWKYLKNLVIRKENFDIMDLLETIVSIVNRKSLKNLKPKIQAPDKATKICLDLLYHDIHGVNDAGVTHRIPSKDILEKCLIMLYSQKIYAESRQEERNRHNVRINRGRYTNPDDTHMYLLYGYILTILGNYELGIEENMGKKRYGRAIQYYTEAIDAYKCAKITNISNNVACINEKILVYKEKYMIDKLTKCWYNEEINES